MDKTTDVAQLSTCCGKPLVWSSIQCAVPGCTCGSAWWDATCPMCGGLNADAMMSPERNLTPTEQMLLARIAELEAALANERGEGEPPVPGWRYDARCDEGRPGVWECAEKELIVTRPLPPAVGWRYARRGGVQVWGQALTARDAMRAASGAADAR